MVTLELRGVHKTHNEGRPDEVRALCGVDLTVAAGTATVVRGPSGSGKTTLLTLAGCLARPGAGRVRIDGRDVSALPEHFLAEVRRTRIGFVFQRFNLIRGLTALENVMVPALPLGIDPAALRARAQDLLDGLGLGGRASARVDWLSGGEAQRVAIARALVNDPALIVADEPTANLDTGLSRRFLALVAGFKREGRAVLIASHDPLVCDDPAVDAVVALRDGRIAGEGA